MAEEKKKPSNLFLHPWQFVRPVAKIDDLPDTDKPEIAFAGRSNVGKSSLLNFLTGQKIAKTSSTPGRTQCLNFFDRDDAPFRFVDMPGYGYAKAPKTMVEGWHRLIRDYILGRVDLRCICLLIDSRHGTKESDLTLLKQCEQAGVLVQPVLTKVDKISDNMLEKTTKKLLDITKKNAACTPTIIATSVKKQQGGEELREKLAQILGLE